MSPSDVIFGTFVVIAVIGAVAMLVRSPRPLGVSRLVEVLLLWTLVALVGLSGLIGGLFHLLTPEMAARSIGWEPSPFQREVGFGDVGIGVLGLLSARLRGLFWWATGIWSFIFFGGASVGHFIEQQVAGNFAPGNAGLVFWIDVFVAVAMLVLLPLYQLTRPRPTPAA
ncbi:MAG: hypothetical protein KatS3mg061_3009 [Dehalococcoidia bacterium]|nr:MAG: hypothetical protein KatS3mg061_3009 [Dehalococcoidia bacterium]